jgi:hypothetical protein
VCNGRITRFCTADANPSQQPTTSKVTVQDTSTGRLSLHTHTIEKTTAGTPPSRQYANIAWS